MFYILLLLNDTKIINKDVRAKNSAGITQAISGSETHMRISENLRTIFKER